MSYNRNQSQRQNPTDLPGFQIREDNTATPPCRYPSNQNNQFVLQPASTASNSTGLPGNPLVREAGGFWHPNEAPVLAGQENATVSPALGTTFSIPQWINANTAPGAVTNVNALTPNQHQAARNTLYYPQGQPVQVYQTAYGYQAHGNWHAEQLRQFIQQREQRPVPDVMPFFTANNIMRADEQYRGTGLGIRGTAWPTPATGINMHAGTIATAQQNGMHIRTIDRNGNVVFIWQGRQ
ncbi:hypothetical protein FSARC_14745 [Fusarium sarcochroum]|uniref:Uncharacterized protein n=1 Tax=Fusarium sarcochroum TaxID=1208366 RepID=A0A8H4SR49_9HYPO|nr:hypothetical protein FSARC_14745 [Fusarium sarcochroum]